jgi:hypothetical protein
MATATEQSHWTKERIAALDQSELARLNYDEMVEIVRASGIPLRDMHWVNTLESDVLVRLVHWARQSCRG